MGVVIYTIYFSSLAVYFDFFSFYYIFIKFLNLDIFYHILVPSPKSILSDPLPSEKTNKNPILQQIPLTKKTK